MNRLIAKPAGQSKSAQPANAKSALGKTEAASGPSACTGHADAPGAPTKTKWMQSGLPPGDSGRKYRLAKPFVEDEDGN